MKVLELNESNIKILTDRANVVLKKEWRIDALISEINERDLDNSSNIEYEVSANYTKSGHIEFIDFRDLLINI